MKPVQQYQTLNLYSDFEIALQRLFQSDNYCIEQCVTQEISKKIPLKPQSIFGKTIPGKYGCCISDYYMIPEPPPGCEEVFAKFDEARSINFISSEHGCRFHTDNGCAIEKYKSPSCLGRICNPYKKRLLDNHAIDYIGETVTKNLWLLLLGFRDQEVIQSIVSILDKGTERIKTGIGSDIIQILPKNMFREEDILYELKK